MRFIALSLALLAAVSSAPQEGDLPDAERLLDEAQRAIGRPATPGSLRERGTSTWVGLPGSGTFENTYDGPRRARCRSEFDSFGVFELGSDGEVVWEKSPLEIKFRDGWAGSEYLRRFGWPQNVPWREMYSAATVTGREELEGRACWRLELTPRRLLDPDGAAPGPDVLHIDVETRLPHRLVARVTGAGDAAGKIETSWSDWREVDGVRHPHTVTVSISGFTLTMKVTSVERGVELPADWFALDGEVREALVTREVDEARQGGGDITIETLPVRHLASIRVKCKHAEMQKTLTVILPETMRHVMAVGAKIDGAPLVRYHRWGDDLDVEGGMPVAEPIEGEGRVQPATLPAGKAVVIWHVGPYDELGRTHERLQAYLREKGLETRGPFWEEYWTDPGMEPDPSKWRTKIVWPIEG